MGDPEVPHKVTLQSGYKENWCELNSIILKMLQSRVVASKVHFKLSEEMGSPRIFLFHTVGGQQQHTASTGKRRNVQGLSWLGKKSYLCHYHFSSNRIKSTHTFLYKGCFLNQDSFSFSLQIYCSNLVFSVLLQILSPLFISSVLLWFLPLELPT